MHRIAMLSVHTSPLDPPGGGDAGGMNVYIVETAKRMADAGIAVEIFTRATSSKQPRAVEMHPGVTVRHVVAGPFEGLNKTDLPGQLCAFTATVLRAEAHHDPGWYDLIHSHYWLSGQVGWLARDRWGVPLVHSAHTLGKVKNASLAQGDTPEPLIRVVGEQQVVDEADRLVAFTTRERDELITAYTADPARIDVVPPGVDLATFAPGEPDRAGVRARLGIPSDARVLLFAGRLQPLKAPDLLLRALALLRADEPRAHAVIVGAPSGTDPDWLPGLARHLDVPVTFVPPVGRAELAEYYRAADLTVMPSYNESFGLVAIESLACGTPVVAAAAGGLPTAVGDAGVLVEGHDPAVWAAALAAALRQPPDPGAARRQACRFAWETTTAGLLTSYRQALASFHASAAAS